MEEQSDLGVTDQGTKSRTHPLKSGAHVVYKYTCERYPPKALACSQLDIFSTASLRPDSRAQAFIMSSISSTSSWRIEIPTSRCLEETLQPELDLGWGVRYTMIIIRNPPNPIRVVKASKAPKLPASLSSSPPPPPPRPLPHLGLGGLMPRRLRGVRRWSCQACEASGSSIYIGNHHQEHDQHQHHNPIIRLRRRQQQHQATCHTHHGHRDFHAHHTVSGSLLADTNCLLLITSKHESCISAEPIPQNPTNRLSSLPKPTKFSHPYYII